MRRGHAFLGATLATATAALWLLWPYLDAILWAGFTAYFLHYFAGRLNRRIDNRAVTTGMMIVLLVGLVTGIFYVGLTSIPTLASFIGRFSSVLSGSVTILVDAFNLSPMIESSLRNVITEMTGEGRTWLLQQVGEIPSFIINLVIYFVVAAFLVKDGKQFRQQLLTTVRALPDDYRGVAISILESLDNLFRGVFLSYFVVALTTGVSAAVGFYLMGIDFYMGWGVIIGIFAFFPIVSAPMVYVPLALLYLGPLEQFWLGVLILVYGIVVLNIVPEVLVRPYVAAQSTKEHPLLLFVGFLVGPLVLGFKGLILGPIILVLAKNMLTMQYFDSD